MPDLCLSSLFRFNFDCNFLELFPYNDFKSLRLVIHWKLQCSSLISKAIQYSEASFRKDSPAESRCSRWRWKIFRSFICPWFFYSFCIILILRTCHGFEVIRRFRFLKKSMTLFGEDDQVRIDRLKNLLKEGLFHIEDGNFKQD